MDYKAVIEGQIKKLQELSPVDNMEAVAIAKEISNLCSLAVILSS